MAAYEGHVAIVNTLIYNGAEVDARDMVSKLFHIKYLINNMKKIPMLTK